MFLSPQIVVIWPFCLSGIKKSGLPVHRLREDFFSQQTYKTRFCALSWLITKIILRCTVSKTPPKKSLICVTKVDY